MDERLEAMITRQAEEIKKKIFTGGKEPRLYNQAIDINNVNHLIVATYFLREKEMESRSSYRINIIKDDQS